MRGSVLLVAGIEPEWPNFIINIIQGFLSFQSSVTPAG